MKDIIEIKPKNPRSRWVAVSLDKKTEILAEGIKLVTVVKKAEKTGRVFVMQWIPISNHTNIFKYWFGNPKRFLSNRNAKEKQ